MVRLWMALVTTVLVSLHSSCVHGEEECPRRWTKSVVKGKCVQVFQFQRHFEQARDWCQMFQTGETALADILSLHSQEENAQIYELAKAQVGDSPLWIGMQMEGEQSARWLDGSPVDYNNFKEEAFNGKVCVSMDILSYGTSSAKWTVRKNCMEETFFACELFLGTPSTTTTTTSTTVSRTSTTTPPFPPQKNCRGFVGQESGVRKVELLDGQIIETYCNIGTNNAFTVIQSRGEENVVSFNRTIDEYERQIGLPGKNTNFWMGLENMRLLMGSNYEYGMVIELCCNEKPGRTTFYSKLKLLGRSDHYTLIGSSMAQVGMNFANYFTDLNSSFSTYDNFHIGLPARFCDVINNKISDGTTSHGTGGWWFGSCANNLNGHYYEMGSPHFSDPSICRLDKEQMGVLGSGVELRTSEEVSEQALDSISWTRARMSIYEERYGMPLGTQPLCG